MFKFKVDYVTLTFDNKPFFMNTRSILFLTLTLLLTACTNYKVETVLSEEKIQEKNQKITETLAEYEKAETDDDKIKYASEAAFEYQLIGEYGKAIKLYKEVIAYNDINFAALNNLAAMYEELGELDEATKYIDLLYSKYSTYPQVIEDVVRIYLKNKQPEGAQRILNEFAATEKGKTEVGFVEGKQKEIDRFNELQKSKK